MNSLLKKKRRRKKVNPGDAVTEEDENLVTIITGEDLMTVPYWLYC